MESQTRECVEGFFLPPIYGFRYSGLQPHSTPNSQHMTLLPSSLEKVEANTGSSLNLSPPNVHSLWCLLVLQLPSLLVQWKRGPDPTAASLSGAHLTSPS